MGRVYRRAAGTQGLSVTALRRYQPARKDEFVDWAIIWATTKTAITDDTGLSRDALHVLTGFTAHVLLAALLRRSVASPVPWFLVLLLAGANEWADYLYETWPGQWKESLKDVVTTMALPSLLVLLSRFAPSLLVRPRRRKDGDQTAGQELVGE